MRSNYQRVDPLELLRKRQVAKLIGVTDFTIDRWWKEGEFPKPVFINKIPRWRRVDVDQWIDQRARVKNPARYSPPKLRRRVDGTFSDEVLK